MQKNFILSVNVNGIKCIDEKKEIIFFDKAFKKVNTFGVNIKGIKGLNGSGKTAFVSGINLMKELVIKTNFLTSNNNLEYLRELINYRINKANIELDFLIITDDGKYRYLHEIEIEKTRKNEIKITKERIASKELYSNHIKSELIIENGKIIKDDIHIGTQKKNVEETTKNLLDKRSIVNIINSTSLECGDLEYIYMFYNNLYISVKKNIKKSENTKGYDLILNIDKLEGFEKNLKNIGDFLRDFKPDLGKISYEMKENEDKLYINIYFKYIDYDISYKNESRGIKNLFSMYKYFEALSNNNVAIIDDLDAKMEYGYLKELIDNFDLREKGQLIFTTRDVLLTKKNIIEIK